MKNLILIASAFCLSLSLASADKIKALILDGQNNHNWKATTPVLKHALESCGKYVVEVATSPAKGQDMSGWNPDFSKHDVIVSNYNGAMWSEKTQKAFIDYVKGGGALVVVHAADNSFGKWEEYNKMIALGGWGGRNEKSGPYLYFKDGEFLRDKSPGRGGSHGPQHEFTVTIRDASHPITKGMPTEWKHMKDELYDSLRGPAENVTVIATAWSAKSKKHEPMMLCITYGKGRVFHTPMGHADYSMRCVGFYNTLQRGAEWAATGKVTLPLSDNFPGKDAVSEVK